MQRQLRECPLSLLRCLGAMRLTGIKRRGRTCRRLQLRFRSGLARDIDSRHACRVSIPCRNQISPNVNVAKPGGAVKTVGPGFPLFTMPEGHGEEIINTARTPLPMKSWVRVLIDPVAGLPRTRDRDPHRSERDKHARSSHVSGRTRHRTPGHRGLRRR